VQHVIDLGQPTLKGKAAVAKNRSGGPIQLAYEVHGTGPIHLVWINGLNAPKIAWHRQTHYFGHDHRNRFTSLVFDNRGIGDSESPFIRYSTSEMAKDALDLCDELGWTGKKQLHIIGVSMGGMIAQELAYAAPDRIASMMLQSTAANLISTLPWYQHLYHRAYMILPKSLEARIAAAKANIFAKEWLHAPDPYGEFPTNGDRFTAEELWRLKALKKPPFFAYLLQGLAATWHYVGPDRLKTIGERVQNVLVCHGTEDVMIPFVHMDALVAGIAMGGCDVQKSVYEGAGHALHIERWDEYHKMVEEFVTKAHAQHSGL